jgi:hypothetical protein
MLLPHAAMPDAVANAIIAGTLHKAIDATLPHVAVTCHMLPHAIRCLMPHAADTPLMPRQLHYYFASYDAHDAIRATCHMIHAIAITPHAGYVTCHYMPHADAATCHMLH